MAGKSDAVTRWWRGLSLRAKVTGVTVTLLVVGLLAAGIGTMAFLRNTLVTSLDDQLVGYARSDVAMGIFDISVADGVVLFDRRADAAPTDYFVAIYGPDGTRLITGGGNSDLEPEFPESITLDFTQARQFERFYAPNATGGAGFHYTLAIYPIENVPSAGFQTLYTQLVALPLAPINQVVGAFLGIYSILALIIIVAGALVTRWLVTLTFRSLGQVETTAMSIAAGDFGQRLTDIEPITTEVGRLKTALNAMLGRVDAAISQRDGAVKQMRRFIGDASHELRTPLVTVRGWAELYRMGAITGDDDIAQAMDRIESEAKRMGLLVEDLLALARLDERRDVLFTEVDLRPVARDAALDLRVTSPLRAVTVIDTTAEPEAPSAPDDAPDAPPTQPRRRGVAPPARRGAGATLALLRRKPRPVPASQAAGTTDPPPPVSLDLTTAAADPSAVAPIVLGDENRIRQVVANLLGNAKRFTSDDSPIELRVGVDAASRMGWIEVADHGEGIPDQIKDKIFQRFWRADTSRARETGGTGLGLSIVSSIIEALHGRVWVLDTPGGGATFHVEFPLAAAREASEHVDIQTQPLLKPRSEPAE